MIRRLACLTLACLLALQAPVSSAQEDEPVRCVSISRISRTEVIDDRTLAFFMTGGGIYLNRLDQACRDLSRRYSFSYESSTGRICNFDSITVRGDSGVGPSRVDSCGLGDFVPATEEDIEMLRDEQPAAEVTVEIIEVEVEDSDAKPSPEVPLTR